MKRQRGDAIITLLVFAAAFAVIFKGLHAIDHPAQPAPQQQEAAQ
jgi:hypothetical protein